MKKGVIEIQFNWIYVGIVGTILLLMFVNIALGIKRNADTRLAIDAQNYFDEIFTSLQSSESTEHSIKLSGIEIEVTTELDNCNFYSIGKTIKPRSIEHLALFSPDVIKNSVLSYSLGWDTPFRSNYFLYLTSPDVAYVFMDFEDLKEDLPEHLSKFSGDFDKKGYYKVRFITKQIPSFSLNNINGKTDVSAIRINPSITGQLYNKGELTFYEKQGSILKETGKTYYFDKPTLFAAIYSENYESYNCNIKKAVTRINKISGVLKDRVALLRTPDIINRCSDVLDHYSDALEELKNLEDLTSSINTDSPEAMYNLMTKLITIKDKLQEHNEIINKRSCPTIY